MNNLNYKNLFFVGKLNKKPFSASLLILIVLFTIRWILYVITENPMSHINTSSDAFCYVYLGIKDNDSNISLRRLLSASGQNMSLIDFRSQSEVNCALFTRRYIYSKLLGLIVNFLGFDWAPIVSLVSFYAFILCILSIPRISNSVAILSIILIMTSPFMFKLVTTINIDLFVCVLIGLNFILVLKIVNEPKIFFLLIVCAITLFVGSLRSSILFLGLPYIYLLVLKWRKHELLLHKRLKVFIPFHFFLIIGITFWNPNNFRVPVFSRVSEIYEPVQRNLPLRSIGELLKYDLSLTILITFYVLAILAMTIENVSIALTVFAYAIWIAFILTELFVDYPSTYLRFSMPLVIYMIFVVSEYYNSAAKRIKS